MLSLCVLRPHLEPRAEPYSSFPPDRVVLQPPGGGTESDDGGTESNQSLRVESAAPAEAAVSPLHEHLSSQNSISCPITAGGRG